MKVSITGHTSGLGQELYNLFPDATVFSRSNGHDLSKPGTIQRIALQAHTSDVFINNAHYQYAQVDLLYTMFNLWKHENKLIVCVGSISSDGNKNYPHDYSIQKSALEKACDQLNNVKGKNCRIILIKPGYIDTPRVRWVEEPKIDPIELAQFIKELIIINKSFWIPKVTFYPTK